MPNTQQDPTQLVVAGTGDLYVAAYGTTLPTNEDTILTGFTKLGYVTEDGVTFNWKPDIQEYAAWQSRSPVRREMTAQEFGITFQLEQWNFVNMQAAFGGGTVSQVTAGHYRFDFLSDTDAISEKSVICDWVDGTKSYRLVLPRVNAVEGADIALKKSDLAVLPVSFKALAPSSGKTAYLFTDDPAFNPAAS